MAAILNFRIFAKNGKTQICFYLLNCEIERFRRNFRPTGYLRSVLFAIFQKFSPPQKWRPFWILEFLPKMAKHKFASISLTVRDREISSKFSTHRVFKECNLYNFQKIFPSPKMAKHKFPSISLTVRDRAISSKFSTHRCLSIVFLAI